MERLIVKLYQKEKEIGIAEYVNITNDKEEDVFNIELTNTSINKTKFQFKEHLKLRVMLNINQFDDLNFILIDFKKNNLNLKLQVKLNDSLYNYWESYSSIQYDIFTKWKNGIRLNWKNFKTELEKFAWIRSCGRLTDITKQKIKSKKITLDFGEVNSKNDFYYLIGEAMLGHKGYLGGDEHALFDCLYYLNLNNPNHKTYIHIKNIKALEVIFNKEFKNSLLNHLKDNGFKIGFE